MEASETSTINLDRVLTPIRVDGAFIDALAAGIDATGETKSEFIRVAVVQRLRKLARKHHKIAKKLEEVAVSS